MEAWHGEKERERDRDRVCAFVCLCVGAPGVSKAEELLVFISKRCVRK